MNQNTSSAMQFVTTENEQRKNAPFREAFEGGVRYWDLGDRDDLFPNPVVVLLSGRRLAGALEVGKAVVRMQVHQQQGRQQ